MNDKEVRKGEEKRRRRSGERPRGELQGRRQTLRRIEGGGRSEENDEESRKGEERRRKFEKRGKARRYVW